LNTGTTLTFRGTVKAHRDGQTQLNRVAVVWDWYWLRLH
jgi:hypothetical protein